MADRKQQLGLEAAILVLKGMAKLHALSKILLDRGDIPLGIFETIMWIRDEIEMRDMMVKSVQQLTTKMESWGDEWKEAIDRLNKLAPELASKSRKALDADPTEFTVLNHGDCWTNNLLFRYGDDPEKPTMVKFIDWQISFVTTPAKDIWNFLLSSVRQEVREQYFDKLLEEYSDALMLNLVKLNYEGSIPDILCLKEMVMKRLILPLCDSFMFVPIVFNEDQNAPDLETVIKESKIAKEKGENPSEDFNRYVNLSPKNECIIKGIVKQAMDANVI